MNVDQRIWAVLASYFTSSDAITRIETLESGGWSGSQIWKVFDEQGRQFCLRRWPGEHPTPARLRLIHDVVCRVASDLPAVAAPLPTSMGETFVAFADRLWQLEDWKPGTADYHLRPTRTRLRAAMRALAQFHQLAAAHESPVGQAPAIRDRQKQIQLLRGGELAAIERALKQPLSDDVDQRTDVLFLLASEALGDAIVARILATHDELRLQPAIRDIHHDHVLFTGDDVSGIIDFGALRIDTPLVDVARLISSLVGDDREARELALASYGEVRPLSDRERQLIELLDESGLVLAAFNWLNWLYVERRDMGASGPIVRRLDEIIGRFQKRRQ
jgi:homoserine kinase type II